MAVNIDLENRFAPFVEGRSLTGLRLADGAGIYHSERDGDAPSPANNQTRILFRPRAASLDQSIFTLHQIFATDPQWDAVRTPDGVYWIVYQYEEGAGAVLILRKTDGADLDLPGPNPTAGFSHPRFARAPARENRPLLTAVSGGNRLLYFSPIKGRYFDGRPLIDACDGLIVDYASALWVFYTTPAMGPIPVPGVCRGVLHAAPLNSDYALSAPPIKPLGDAHIYAFDAVSVSGRLAILAASDHGLALTLGKPLAGVFGAERSVAIAGAGAIAQPSIAVEDSQLRLAFLKPSANGGHQALSAAVPITEILGTH